MDLIFLWIFWLSIFAVFYTYFLYPVLLAAMTLFIKRPIRKRDIFPAVTIIIAAHNEEKDIREKLNQTLTLSYPKEKLEIIVASDASCDTTNEIVAEFKERGVVLVEQKERLGKTAAQNRAVKVARGEIIIFSDATTQLDQEIVKKLVRNFADEKVGCVAANLAYLDKNTGTINRGRSLYWRYEKFLRRAESSIHSLLGVSGCCYAVRKSIYQKIDPRLISDFVIAWLVVGGGYRAVFEPQARVYEDIVESTQQEIGMRTRVASRSLVALRMMKQFLNPLKFGFFAFELLSHKVLRYAVPVFFILVFVSNLFLLALPLYRIFFLIEVLCIILAVAGMLLPGKGPLKVLAYFVIGNFSILKAFFRFRSSKQFEVWQPLRGKD